MGFFVLNKKLPAKKPLLERLANLVLVGLDLRFEVLAATRKAFAIRWLPYYILGSRFKSDAAVKMPECRSNPGMTQISRRTLQACGGAENNPGTEVGNPAQRPVAFLSGLMLKS